MKKKELPGKHLRTVNVKMEYTFTLTEEGFQIERNISDNHLSEDEKRMMAMSLTCDSITTVQEVLDRRLESEEEFIEKIKLAGLQAGLKQERSFIQKALLFEHVGEERYMELQEEANGEKCACPSCVEKRERIKSDPTIN